MSGRAGIGATWRVATRRPAYRGTERLHRLSIGTHFGTHRHAVTFRTTPRHASASGSVRSVSGPPSVMKVLVIEDDPTVGNFVRRGLEEQRWGVQLVADGEEGERLATSDAYGVVILDMRLPGKSGMDVLNSLRARGFRTSPARGRCKESISASSRRTEKS